MAISIAELKRSRAKVKKERKTLISQMEELLSKDNGNLDENDSARFQELERMVKDHDEQIDDHNDRIEQLESFHELAAKNAASDEDDDDKADDEDEKFYHGIAIKAPKSNVVIRHARAKSEPAGTRWARYLIGAGLAKSWGSITAGARYIQDGFGDDEVAKALNATQGQAGGGALIPQDFVAELIELLRAQTVVRGGGARVFPMPAGNLTLPRLRGPATAQWQDEVTDIAASNQAFDNLQLTAHKLTALTACSNDLIRRSPISVEAIVREDLSRQLALAEDLAFLTSDGTSNRPTGMLSSAGFTHTNTTAVTLAVVLAELNLAELNLRSANVPMDSVKWIFNPALRAFLQTLTDSVGRPFFADELRAGTLQGFPYAMTNQLPTNIGGGTNQQYLFLAAMDQLIIADTMSQFADSSNEATVVTSGTSVSAFQRDQTIFRCISEVDFAVRHSKAIHVSTVQSWTPSGYTTAAGAAYSTESANTSDSSAGSAVTT